MQYRISEDAERDLEEIFLYWANRASLESADRIVDRITERFWLVGEHPNAGKPAGNIARGVRCFPAGKYLIDYRNTRRGTDILHIFHGAPDQKRAFKTLKKTYIRATCQQSTNTYEGARDLTDNGNAATKRVVPVVAFRGENSPQLTKIAVRQQDLPDSHSQCFMDSIRLRPVVSQESA